MSEKEDIDTKINKIKEEITVLSKEFREVKTKNFNQYIKNLQNEIWEKQKAYLWLIQIKKLNTARKEIQD